MRRSACSAGARVIASRRQTLCRGYGQRFALYHSRRALSFCPISGTFRSVSVAFKRGEFEWLLVVVGGTR